MTEKTLRWPGHARAIGPLLKAGTLGATLARECREGRDLVVLDIRLEGMDGIDCLRTIMEKRRDLPVILNSAYSTYKQDFASWMADAYVVKSADLTELKDKIKECLAKRGKV